MMSRHSPTILDTLAAEARERVAEDQRLVGTSLMKQWAQASDPHLDFPFEQALRGDSSADGTRPLRFICEVKKASPSKGLISPDFPYLSIARDYAESGAAAISVLTEPRHFLGSDRYLSEIAATVPVPVLRKDFTVDAYQLYQARALGASAVLLICALLSDDHLAELLGLADELGLSVLTETHDAAEIERAVRLGARVIGVNNRNLHDFSVDVGNAASLRDLVPPDRLFVGESGVMSVEDAAQAAQMGADAVLVGEFLMRAQDRRGVLRRLTGVRAMARRSRDTPVAGSLPQSARRVTRPPRIKICGLTRDADMTILNELRPDYAGFIFHPASKRYVSLDSALHLRGLLDPRVATVGVFVDAPLSVVGEAVESGAISLVQLHGQEDAAYVEALRTRAPGAVIIKGVRASDLATVRAACSSHPDFLLLDGPEPGSGRGFDWALLADLLADTDLPPVFLAGGLTPENVGAVCHHDVYAIDVSSGVEEAGRKDPSKLRALVAMVRTSVATRTNEKPGRGSAQPPAHALVSREATDPRTTSGQ